MYVTWQQVNADGVLARSGENGEARKKCAVQYHWEAIVTFLGNFSSISRSIRKIPVA